MDLINKYFSHMKDVVSTSGYSCDDYEKLLRFLFNKKFISIIPLDDNRIVDAIEFRAEFERSNGYFEPIIKRDISVLEIMVSLAVRCEDSIMGNTNYGDRTGEWFWYMIKSMELLPYTDWSFDEVSVNYILDKMINRTYSKDGLGSLFYIPNFKKDMRKIDIWYQMNNWLTTIDD